MVRQPLIPLLPALLLGLQLLCPVFSADQARADDSTLPMLSFKSGEIPERLIIYSDDTPAEWKNVWDRARKLFQAEDFQQARIQYELLLVKKPTINQARWEYVTVLSCLRLWEEAATELEILLAGDPDQFKYRLALAEIDLGLDAFHRATERFSLLYESYCTPGATPAAMLNRKRILSGYIEALHGVGRVEDTLPLMEQLIVLQPKDYSLSKKAAAIALEFDRPEMALSILEGLAAAIPDDSEVWQELSLVQEILGNNDGSAASLQCLVALDPNNLSGHSRLITYYRNADSPSMELKHVRELIRLLPEDRGLRIHAARLSHNLGRSDWALLYFNGLLVEEPGNKEIQQQKQLVIEQLAANLLVLIENNGPGMLWQDLVQFTDDRMGIYLAMAEMLRDRARYRELIQVLLVIEREQPENTEIHKELDRLVRIRNLANVHASSRRFDSGKAVSIKK